MKIDLVFVETEELQKIQIRVFTEGETQRKHRYDEKRETGEHSWRFTQPTCSNLVHREAFMFLRNFGK